MKLPKSPLLLFIAASICFFAYGEVEKNESLSKNESFPKSYYYKQFEKVLDIVDQHYVRSPDMQKMLDAGIDGMLRSLDPYSGYYVGDDLEFFRDHTDGEFGGIGVEVIYDNGVIKILSPIDDLPADKAGIKSGDYILGIDGELVSNLGYMKSIKLMRGKPGSEVTLLIARENDTPKEVKLNRELVHIKPVKYEIEKDELGYFGYVRISTFNKKTSIELKNAINSIKTQAENDKQKFCGIVLDLRDNPGGLLDQAVAVAEYFVNEGVIVTIKDRKSQHKISSSRFVAKFPDIPVIILVNNGSASASEIVAGAMQDHNRALILGTKSFGKGLVQTFTPINERAAVKFTTAEYCTPSGRFINGKGITPNIVVEQVELGKDDKNKNNLMSKSHIKDFLKKYKQNTTNNEKQILDKNKQNSDKAEDNKIIEMSDRYKTDYQYSRAYDLIRGMVYISKKI